MAGIYITEAVETCPHCDCDNVFTNYDVVGNGYKAVCWNCGRTIFLCDECFHADDNPEQKCDWHERTRNGICYGKCFRGETRNGKEV